MYINLDEGVMAILQSKGKVDWSFDTELDQPAYFSYNPNAASANVNVVYADGTTDLIDALWLSSMNALIKKIKTENTTANADDIRLVR